MKDALKIILKIFKCEKTTLEKGHGRIEKREYYQTMILNDSSGFFI